LSHATFQRIIPGMRGFDIDAALEKAEYTYAHWLLMMHFECRETTLQQIADLQWYQVNVRTGEIMFPSERVKLDRTGPAYTMLLTLYEATRFTSLIYPNKEGRRYVSVEAARFALGQNFETSAHSKIKQLTKVSTKQYRNHNRGLPTPRFRSAKRLPMPETVSWEPNPDFGR